MSEIESIWDNPEAIGLNDSLVLHFQHADGGKDVYYVHLQAHNEVGVEENMLELKPAPEHAAAFDLTILVERGTTCTEVLSELKNMYLPKTTVLNLNKRE